MTGDAVAYAAEPTVWRQWVYKYKRPARMGWPNVEWTDAWKPDRRVIVNPLEIAVTVDQPVDGAPVARRVRVKGRWGGPRPEPGRIKRLDTPWIALTLPGHEREATADRTAAPDWVAALAADAQARAAADRQECEVPAPLADACGGTDGGWNDAGDVPRCPLCMASAEQLRLPDDEATVPPHPVMTVWGGTVDLAAWRVRWIDMRREAGDDA